MIYLISMVCLMCGGMLTDVIDSIVHHQFPAFYSQHTALFWATLAVNTVVLFLLMRSLVRVISARINNTAPQERAGVGHSGLGITFYTTSFVRVTVYTAFYIIGVALAFL